MNHDRINVMVVWDPKVRQDVNSDQSKTNGEKDVGAGCVDHDHAQEIFVRNSATRNSRIPFFGTKLSSVPVNECFNRWSENH